MKKITQNTCFLGELVSRACFGELVPAGMQRPYAWSAKDVEDLCNSILEQFPIGSFLTWVPNETETPLISKGRIGPFQESERPYATGLLLDGQNRIASLAWLLGFDKAKPDNMSPQEKEVWSNDKTLCLDLSEDTPSIRFVDNENVNSGLLVPAWTLVGHMRKTNGMSEVMNKMMEISTRWKAQLPEKEIDRLFRKWDDACHCFRNAKVVETVLFGFSPEEAKNAFLKIAKCGVPISDKDFDDAMGWSAEKPKAKKP